MILVLHTVIDKIDTIIKKLLNQKEFNKYKRNELILYFSAEFLKLWDLLGGITTAYR